jgi:hypothetical protein
MNTVVSDNISSLKLIELLSNDVEELSNWDTDLLPVSNIQIAKMIKKGRLINFILCCKL